jgi:2'-5' RNA ligase
MNDVPAHFPDDGHTVVSYFVTTFVPEPLACELEGYAQRLPEGSELQTADRMHITFRSFDGLPHGLLNPLKEAIRELAARWPPFRIQVAGGGSFDAGAIWVRADSPEIYAFQADIDRVLTDLGLPGASHPFIAHVTLGHAPPGNPIPPFVEQIRGEFTADEILLTTTGAAEYRVVLRASLGESEARDP